MSPTTSLLPNASGHHGCAIVYPTLENKFGHSHNINIHPGKNSNLILKHNINTENDKFIINSVFFNGSIVTMSQNERPSSGRGFASRNAIALETFLAML